jgi:hypothetical protein
MRQDHEQAGPVAGLRQPQFQIGQIAPHRRADISVHDRGRDPFIFLDLRQHIARPGNADVRQFAREALHGRDFVDGVEVGMQKANRDRSGAGAVDGGDGRIER